MTHTAAEFAAGLSFWWSFTEGPVAMLDMVVEVGHLIR